jgi:hypothetical protein
VVVSTPVPPGCHDGAPVKTEVLPQFERRP